MRRGKVPPPAAADDADACDMRILLTNLSILISRTSLSTTTEEPATTTASSLASSTSPSGLGQSRVKIQNGRTDMTSMVSHDRM